MPRARLVRKTGAYMHWECHSAVFGFVDDLEFLVDAGGSRIEIRSAARTGYSDLGVNRRRLERICELFYARAPAVGNGTTG